MGNGSRKRREVVFSSMESSIASLSRSASFLSEDDIPFLNKTSSTPDLTSDTTETKDSNFASSLLSIASSLESEIGASSSGSNSSLKPLKVKDRWRYSSDVELRKSLDNDSAPTTDLSSMSLAETQESLDMVAPEQRIKVIPLSEHHTKQTGHLVFDSRDKELQEKLKKFEGLDENLYRTYRKISKESKGMVCDCFVSKEEVSRGEVGCNEHCLNRLLMVEW